MTFVEYKNLNKELLKASELYYNKGYTIMTDYDFDIKLKKIEEYEKNNKDKILKNSISKKPGISNKKNKVLLDVRMLSLKNAYIFKDIEKWLKHINLRYGVKNFNLTYKYDGLAVCLVYYKGVLVKAHTRGDGTHGLDILEHVNNIDIPKNLYLPGYTFVLGELILTDKNFKRVNKILNNKYKNNRNAVSGIINTNNVDKRISSKITFLPYDMHNSMISLSKTDKLKYLTTLGFDKPLMNLKFNKVEDLKHIYGLLIKNDGRDSLEIPIDGLVIEVDNRHLHYIDISEEKYKALAIALKLPPKTYETKLKDISWTKTKTGKLVPVGILEPIVTDEITISKVNLYNIEFIKNMDLKLKDNVTIIRSGDVIPKLIKRRHTKQSVDIIIPK